MAGVDMSTPASSSNITDTPNILSFVISSIKDLNI